jgi:glutathione synthase/RimK-type ligase-like ATP-grasp enzyme
VPACAFLSTDRLDEFVVYDALAVGPLEALGWTVETVPWRADADWGAFDAVVIRSPWDYQDDPDAFLAVLEAIDASGARLENGLDVVRWNLEKTYLRDLEARGVRTVPTEWGAGLTAEALAALLDRWGEAVVKPVVGANADDTFRLRPTDEAARQRALGAFADGRPCLAQPFVRAVVEEGEFSVFTFGGETSHAILKTPASGDFRVQEEHGGAIRAVEPEPSLGALAEAALAAVPHPEPLLYARVDAVRMPDGGFAVMELELIEPSLYFPYAPGSAERFARALDARLRAG